MSISVTQVQDRLETDLDENMIQLIIDAETESLERAKGKASVTETHNASGSRKLVLRRKPASITSIAERTNLLDDAVTLSVNDWRQIGTRVLLRLPDGDNPAGSWGKEVVVTYTAEIDTNLRDRVILDLVQLSIEFRAFEREKAGDWEGEQESYNERRKVLLNQIREPMLPFV